MKIKKQISSSTIIPKSYSEEEIRKLFGDFPIYFKELSHFVYTWSLRKGFDRKGVKRNDAEQIALMHSELSEALEYLRNGNPSDDKIPDFSGVEAELADVIIRIMNYAGADGLRIGDALLAKLAHNEGRPYKHGKEF